MLLFRYIYLLYPHGIIIWHLLSHVWLTNRVTSPEFSQIFYDASPSKDKNIKLYEGMYHALTMGETDENIDMIFQDITDWLGKRI
mmetsp:Transcript_25567/g.58987  ORF Transcript_25567/g.58987 Transcript_25567/m.58987 type:complete len:85 (-) Transcript_25567:96-350(-)